MVEYVKWCNSRDDLAHGSLSRVVLRTWRYSEKRLSIISCFFDVNLRVLRIMHFLKVLPAVLKADITHMLDPSGVKVLLLEGGVRFLPAMNRRICATPAPRRIQ